jgi:hypothetical protein
MFLILSNHFNKICLDKKSTRLYLLECCLPNKDKTPALGLKAASSGVLNQKSLLAMTIQNLP